MVFLSPRSKKKKKKKTLTSFSILAARALCFASSSGSLGLFGWKMIEWAMASWTVASIRWSVSIAGETKNGRERERAVFFCVCEVRF